jgi:hypothetical protein
MDWVATGSMLTGLGAVVGAGAIIHATRKGADIFAQWQLGKDEDRRIALAEQSLALAYRLRRAIEAIRSPAIPGAERSEIHRQLRDAGAIDDRTPDYASGYLASAHATTSRAAAHKPLWDDLLGALPAIKAMFGDEIDVAVEEFWTQRDGILAAAERYARLARQSDSRAGGYDQEELFRLQRELEATLWLSRERREADAVADAIDGAIAALERGLLPIIRSECG